VLKSSFRKILSAVKCQWILSQCRNWFVSLNWTQSWSLHSSSKS